MGHKHIYNSSPLLSVCSLRVGRFDPVELGGEHGDVPHDPPQAQAPVRQVLRAHQLRNRRRERSTTRAEQQGWKGARAGRGGQQKYAGL
eukprot:763269-Hanusia_phi.AAC.1